MREFYTFNTEIEYTEDEIIKRWNEIGFNDRLPEELIKPCSFAYEDGAKILIEKHSKLDYIDVVMFPMIRRILTDKEFDINMFDIQQLISIIFEEYFENNILQIIPTHKEGDGIDYEAASTALFCDYYIALTKGENHGKAKIDLTFKENVENLFKELESEKK